MIRRIVTFLPKDKRASSKQVLFHCGALKGSLNAQTLAGEVTSGLVRREKTLTDVAARCMDGCYTNSAAYDIFDEASDDLGLVVALTALCLSHGINNAGEKANFVLLKLFWTLIQKVFSKSEKAKEIFFQ